MRLLIISPYHSGSHAAWAEGYRRRSGHTVALLTLPGRFWKWRMHGGAVTLARQFLTLDFQPDLILATDMLDLTTFLALTRTRVKTAVYMHENQLTYPLPGDPADGPMRRQKGERDLHYAFVNYASMLAADRVFFNSDYHRQSLLDALPNFLKHFPDFQELNGLPALVAKSETLPVGVDLRRLRTAGGVPPKPEPPPFFGINGGSMTKTQANFSAPYTRRPRPGCRSGWPWAARISGDGRQNLTAPWKSCPAGSSMLAMRMRIGMSCWQKRPS